MEDSEVPETLDLSFFPLFADSFFAEAQEPIVPEFGSATHKGLVRSENQNHYAIVERGRSQVVLNTNMPKDDLPDTLEKAYLLIVAGGMGGGALGKLASRLAIQTVWELAGRASNWIMKFTDGNSLEIYKRLDAYSQRIQQEFQDRHLENPQFSRMGTTWTSAYLVNHHVLIAHLGDSRAYLWDGQSLRKLTRDQTVAQDYIDEGVPAEWAKPFRHILTNCFGACDEDAPVDFHHAQARDRDVLLLCTDGLTELVSDDEIREAIETMSNPQTTCDQLLQLALDRGGPGNITIIVARFESGMRDGSG